MDIKLRDSIVSIEEEKILANDVTFPHEYNPHSVKLWVIGNEYGATCAVWADCEQGVIDEATDAGLMDAFLVDEEDIEEELLEDGFYSHLGNAGELADLSGAWIKAVDLSIQDIKLIIAFAEARGACVDNLYEV